MATRLSVNINKIATLRNARAGNLPDLLQVAKDIERFGAMGITVHPRPDERHIRYEDVRNLKKVLRTELNVEGNPQEEKFLDLVSEVCPAQVTLVPDKRENITSNAGWDCVQNQTYLKSVVHFFHTKNIRVSIFIDPNTEQIKAAKDTQTDRVELYTESYAGHFLQDKEKAVRPYVEVANLANGLGLELNAGHDLNLENIRFLVQKIPFLKEVSIGHALICESLYFGLESVIRQYLQHLNSCDF